MRTHTVVVLVAALSGVACSKNDQDKPKTSPPPPPPAAPAHIEIPAGLSPAHRAAAEQARDALLAACASTPLDWNLFKEVSLTTSNASGYLRDKYDWDLVVTVALVYRDDVDLERGGHRITFDMGAGSRAGIVTRKSQGIQLCGFTGKSRGVSSGNPCDPNGGEDCILEVPGLHVLDAARPPAVVESQGTAPPAWCFAHGFDPPSFWTCKSSEKSCNAARAVEKREEHDDYRVRSGCSKTEALHCFASESGRTVCASDAASCTTSRKQWMNSGTATPCELGTEAMLTASNERAK